MDVEVGPSDAELLQSARPWLSQLRRLAPDADASSLGEDEKAELLTDAVACETKMKGMLDVDGELILNKHAVCEPAYIAAAIAIMSGRFAKKNGTPNPTAAAAACGGRTVRGKRDVIHWVAKLERLEAVLEQEHTTRLEKERDRSKRRRLEERERAASMQTEKVMSLNEQSRLRKEAREEQLRREQAEGDQEFKQFKYEVIMGPKEEHTSRWRELCTIFRRCGLQGLATETTLEAFQEPFGSLGFRILPSIWVPDAMQYDNRSYSLMFYLKAILDGSEGRELNPVHAAALGASVPVRSMHPLCAGGRTPPQPPPPAHPLLGIDYEAAKMLHRELSLARFERFVSVAMKALDVVMPDDNELIPVEGVFDAVYFMKRESTLLCDAGSTRCDGKWTDNFYAVNALHDIQFIEDYVAHEGDRAPQNIRDQAATFSEFLNGTIRELLQKSVLRNAAEDILEFAELHYWLHQIIASVVHNSLVTIGWRTFCGSWLGGDQMMRLLRNPTLGTSEGHVNAMLRTLGQLEYYTHGRLWAKYAADPDDDQAPTSLCFLADSFPAIAIKVKKLFGFSELLRVVETDGNLSVELISNPKPPPSDSDSEDETWQQQQSRVAKAEAKKKAHDREIERMIAGDSQGETSTSPPKPAAPAPTPPVKTPSPPSLAPPRSIRSFITNKPCDLAGISDYCEFMGASDISLQDKLMVARIHRNFDDWYMIKVDRALNSYAYHTGRAQCGKYQLPPPLVQVYTQLDYSSADRPDANTVRVGLVVDPRGRLRCSRPNCKSTTHWQTRFLCLCDATKLECMQVIDMCNEWYRHVEATHGLRDAQDEARRKINLRDKRKRESATRMM